MVKKSLTRQARWRKAHAEAERERMRVRNADPDWKANRAAYMRKYRAKMKGK